MTIELIGYCNDRSKIQVTKLNASGDMEFSGANLAGAQTAFGNRIRYAATVQYDGISSTAGLGTQNGNVTNSGQRRGNANLTLSWPAQAHRVAGVYTDTVTVTITADS